MSHWLPQRMLAHSSVKDIKSFVKDGDSEKHICGETEDFRLKKG